MNVIEKLKGLVLPSMAPTVDEDEDDDFEDFFGDDDWEDGPAVEKIKAQYPESWMIVKVTNYTQKTLEDVKEWCEAYCSQEWAQIGWRSSCSSTVGVIFEGHTDAVMFKLTWGS